MKYMLTVRILIGEHKGGWPGPPVRSGREGPALAWPGRKYIFMINARGGILIMNMAKSKVSLICIQLRLQ